MQRYTFCPFFQNKIAYFCPFFQYPLLHHTSYLFHLSRHPLALASSSSASIAQQGLFYCLLVYMHSVIIFPLLLYFILTLAYLRILKNLFRAQRYESFSKELNIHTFFSDKQGIHREWHPIG